jgi:hypothetical protein
MNQAHRSAPPTLQRFEGDALVRHARETETVIAYEIETGAPSAYLELRLLSGKWARQAQKWRKKQAKRKMSGKTQAP